MGKKTELRVTLNGDTVDVLQEFCNQNGGLSWAAAVRVLIHSTKTPRKVERQRSVSSGGESIQ